MMDLFHSHPWDLEVDEAIRLQQELRSLVTYEPLPQQISTIGGVDVGFRNEKARAAVVVLKYPSMQLLDLALAEVEIPFPYVPGLLSFREMPAILAALEMLGTLPDVLMVDGQGIAHPRRFGIASHLGVLLEKPTIGCAKSVLTGKFSNLGEKPGSRADLLAGDEVIGIALRSRLKSKPLIISVGHRVTLVEAVRLVEECLRGYRLPEPTRRAHMLASGPQLDLKMGLNSDRS